MGYRSRGGAFEVKLIRVQHIMCKMCYGSLVFDYIHVFTVITVQNSLNKTYTFSCITEMSRKICQTLNFTRQ